MSGATNLSEAITSLLMANADLVALIGDRLYPDMLPENVTLPAMRYQEVSLVIDYSHSGDDGMDTVRVQFDSYAAERITATQVHRALRAAISGRQAGPVGLVQIQSCLLDNSLGSYEDGLNAWRRIDDYLIRYRVGG